MIFNIGETIICSCEVKAKGAVTDPETSMKISIRDSNNVLLIDKQDAVRDGTGKYHCDYQSATSTMRGKFTVFYTATDGPRISICKDEFFVE